jgi:hypothetical protein
MRLGRLVEPPLGEPGQQHHGKCQRAQDEQREQCQAHVVPLDGAVSQLAFSSVIPSGAARRAA